MDHADLAAQSDAPASSAFRGSDMPRCAPWTLMLRLPPEPRVATVQWDGGNMGRDNLPYPDDSIDCVVLQSVSEPMGGSHDAGAQKEFGIGATLKSLFPLFRSRAWCKSQLQHLAEVRRVLKPDGQVVLLVRNRYDHGYFRGQRDSCSGLRYTSLLPRPVANAYSILTTGKPYRACTHSARAYRRLLFDSGYGKLEMCGLTPGYRRPKALIPFQIRGQTWDVAPSRGLERVRRDRRFIPAYAIIASTTAPARASIAAEIARGIEDSLQAEPGSCVFSDFRITSKNKGIIKGEVGDRSIIVKVAFDAIAESGNQRNYQFLEQAEHTADLRSLVPQPIATGSVCDVRYYAESRVRGAPLDDLLNADNASRYLADISAALYAINPDLHERQPQPFAGDVYRRQVLDPLDRIEQTIGRHPLMDRVRACFHSYLDGVSIRQGLVHGDFCSSNITVLDFTVAGIIDWEDAYDGGISALDALNYVEPLYRNFVVRGATTAEVLSRLDQWDRLAMGEQRFLEEHYQRCGLDRACHFALTYLYWVHHVADQLNGELGNDPQALEDRAVRPLEQFVARAQS